MKFKKILMISIIGVLIFAAGCAKTVTPLPNVGNQISMTITFRGNVDTTNNKYYLVFSGASPVVPYKNVYFFGPGEIHDQSKMNYYPDLNSYYSNVFSTWSDFVLIKNNLSWITKGPFIYAQDSSYQAQSLFPSATGMGTKNLTLTLSLFNLSSIPQTLYFNVVTVDQNGIEQDFLRASDNKISTVTGTQIYGRTEASDTSIDGSLDITGWSMVVQ